MNKYHLVFNEYQGIRIEAISKVVRGANKIDWLICIIWSCWLSYCFGWRRTTWSCAAAGNVSRWWWRGRRNCAFSNCSSSISTNVNSWICNDRSRIRRGRRRRGCKCVVINNYIIQMYLKKYIFYYLHKKRFQQKHILTGLGQRQRRLGTSGKM